MIDIATATADDFAERVGEVFAIEFTDAGRFVLVDATPSPYSGAAGQRQPFALHFHGPPDAVLHQNTYRLHNEATGPIDIFLVPVARDEDRATYEAVFA
jgi:hypothetical protein